MSINISMHHVVGAVIVVAFFTAWWFLRRVYKRISRRCPKKGCGHSRVRRIFYIYLHPDDRKLSIISATGKPRWFIRRVVKLTLAECECGWTRLVKVDWDAISLWHAWWTRWRHKEQYDQPSTEHALVIYGGVRKLYHDKGAELDPQETDTPPVPDVLDEFLKDLDELIQHSLGE